ncbi:MAG: DUF2254 family protein [Clostridia bacterium]|nr:DUF2254 family protein [Clostridia bacterium]
MKKLKLFFYHNLTWVYTLQYILYSLIIILLVGLVDLGVIPLRQILPDFLFMEKSLMQTVLTTLAGALLTITTFTFSTILTVLGAYASNYTPRVVENFLQIKITTKVLGIFIGGFFYCVAELLVVKNISYQYGGIAGTVAILYSILCIVYFIFFVQKVIKQFQGVNLISDVYKDAKISIEKEIKTRKETKEYKPKSYSEIYSVKSKNSGYLNLIDTDKLNLILQDYRGLLTINAKIGQFVDSNAPVAMLQTDDKVDEKLLDKLSDGFVFEDSKIVTTDYRYNLTKLVEIALRAISPSVNDPNTCIHVIKKLGVLLEKLSSVDEKCVLAKNVDKCEIFYSSYTFEEDLFFMFGQIIHYASDDISVISAILDSLTSILYKCTPANKEALIKLVKHIANKSYPKLESTYEREEIKKLLKHFLSSAKISEFDEQGKEIDAINFIRGETGDEESAINKNQKVNIIEDKEE